MSPDGAKYILGCVCLFVWMSVKERKNGVCVWGLFTHHYSFFYICTTLNSDGIKDVGGDDGDNKEWKMLLNEVYFLKNILFLLFTVI